MDRRDHRSLPSAAWAVALALVAAGLIAPAAAAADTIAVTTTADEFDSTPNSTCSLREAVETANADTDFGGCTQAGTSSGPDTITIPAGTYSLGSGAGEEANATGDLDVRNTNSAGDEATDLSFQGVGDGTNPVTDTIVDAGDNDRAIDVQDDPINGTDVALNDLTIENGSVTGDGGGVRMQDTNGTITLNRSTVRDSDATGDGGGLVLKGGIGGDEHQLRVIDSELDGNAASGEGGGVFAEVASPDPSGSNSVEVDGSTLSQNSSTEAGGGAYLEGVGRLDLLNSTLTQDSAGGGGGAIAMGSSNPELHLQFSTIADNSTSSADPLAGGGIQGDSDSDLIYIEGTILANNQRLGGLAANCGELDTASSDGVFHATSLGYNLESANTCGLTGTGDRINANPSLGSLADNGGETRTRALQLGSPAIDAVPNSPTDHCRHTEVPGGSPVTVDLTTDQRGKVRPSGAGGFCDVGAWEGQPPSSAPVITDTDPDSPSFSATPSVKGTSSTDSVTVQVFARANCAGPAFSDTRAHFANPGIQVGGILLNQLNSLSARAVSSDALPSGCSSSFPYVHDNIALTPALTATNPASGGDENNPAVKGTAEAGSTVRIYSAGSCPSGTPLASGPQVVFSGTGLTLTVPDNSTTQLVASYTDLAGNVSPCSSAFTYSEVTPPPTTSLALTPSPPPKKKCKKKRQAAASKKCKQK